MSRTEFDLFVKFKGGSALRTARMNEVEIETLFAGLNPSKVGNESILEVQLYRYDIEETETFVKRMPLWGANA